MMNIDMTLDIPIANLSTNLNDMEILCQAFREIDNRPISFCTNSGRAAINGVIHSAKIVEEYGEIFARCKGVLFSNIIPECQVEIADNKIAYMKILGFGIEK